MLLYIGAEATELLDGLIEAGFVPHIRELLENANGDKISQIDQELKSKFLIFYFSFFLHTIVTGDHPNILDTVNIRKMFIRELSCANLSNASTTCSVTGGSCIA